MDNYASVIDISSDEENNRYCTPIKTLPVIMVGRLDLSDSSVEVKRGGEADFCSTSVSTFETLSSLKKVNLAQKEYDEKSAFTMKTTMRSRSPLVNYRRYSRRQNCETSLTCTPRAMCRQLKSTN